MFLQRVCSNVLDWCNLKQISECLHGNNTTITFQNVRNHDTS